MVCRRHERAPEPRGSAGPVRSSYRDSPVGGSASPTGSSLRGLVLMWWLLLLARRRLTVADYRGKRVGRRFSLSRADAARGQVSPIRPFSSAGCVGDRAVGVLGEVLSRMPAESACES